MYPAVSTSLGSASVVDYYMKIALSDSEKKKIVNAGYDAENNSTDSYLPARSPASSTVEAQVEEK